MTGLVYSSRTSWRSLKAEDTARIRCQQGNGCQEPATHCRTSYAEMPTKGQQVYGPFFYYYCAQHSELGQQRDSGLISIETYREKVWA